MPLRFNERETAVNGNVLLIVLLVVSLLCAIVYTAEGEEGPLHRLQAVAGVVASPISAAGAGIQSAQVSAQTTLDDLRANPETVSELKEQNEQLRQMVSELEEYRQEAERLAGIQKLSDTYGIEGLTCHVVGMRGESWNRVITIDKGSADGVSAGLPVMGATGLVGQVSAVAAGTSDVRLLQDSRSGVAVMLQSSRAEGLLKGNIDGLLYLEDVDADVEVKVGETVVTSGLGGGYFRGLIVGTVARVADGNGQSIRQIVVAPNDAVSGLEEVMVVTSVSAKKNAADNPDAAKEASAASSSSAAADGDAQASGDGDAREGSDGDSPDEPGDEDTEDGEGYADDADDDSGDAYPEGDDYDYDEEG